MVDKKKINIDLLKLRAKTDPYVAAYLRLVIKGEEIRRRLESENDDSE